MVEFYNLNRRITSFRALFLIELSAFKLDEMRSFNWSRRWRSSPVLGFCNELKLKRADIFYRNTNLLLFLPILKKSKLWSPNQVNQPISISSTAGLEIEVWFPALDNFDSLSTQSSFSNLKVIFENTVYASIGLL